MKIELEDICPDCFSIDFFGGLCRKCGFSQKDITLPEGALKMRSILKDRYIVGRVLGKGGFGITYKAFDLEKQDYCAIKEYMPKYLMLLRDNDKLYLVNSAEQEKYDHGISRFQEEAQILARLRNYPHVVAVRDIFQENNTCYYVMNFVEGINLKRVIRDNKYRYGLKEALDVIECIGDTLQDIHTKEQLIHRDISPENILLDKEGNYTLIDFGSAKTVKKGTVEGATVVLKPGFAPLEQYTESMPQGAYTDVYALAGTFYYMLTGQMLPSAMERLNRPECYLPLVMIRKDVGQKISDAVDRALEVNYKKRTQSVKQFLDELQSAAGEINVRQSTNYFSSQRDEIVGKKVGILEIVNGIGKGKQWMIPDDGKVRIIGRDSNQCHIVMNYREISRKHLKLRFNSEKGLFEGRECSRNGTFVDKNFYHEQIFEVKPGSLLQFPETECVLYLGVDDGKP